MKKRKFTPWFTGVEVPERIGVYERRLHNDLAFYSYWDGRQWWPSDSTPVRAAEKFTQYRNIGVPRWCSQLLSWRGIIR